MYDVITDPPFDAGGVNERVISPSAAIAESKTGAFGGAPSAGREPAAAELAPPLQPERITEKISVRKSNPDFIIKKLIQSKSKKIGSAQNGLAHRNN